MDLYKVMKIRRKVVETISSNTKCIGIEDKSRSDTIFLLKQLHKMSNYMVFVSSMNCEDALFEMDIGFQIKEKPKIFINKYSSK